MRTDKRSLADVYPELPKKGIIYDVGSLSVGLVRIQNNGVEPVDIEIEYELVDGNVPILLQNRKDNTPIVIQKRVYRTETINPKESRDVAFGLIVSVL